MLQPKSSIAKVVQQYENKQIAKSSNQGETNRMAKFLLASSSEISIFKPGITKRLKSTLLISTQALDNWFSSYPPWDNIAWSKIFINWIQAKISPAH